MGSRNFSFDVKFHPAALLPFHFRPCTWKSLQSVAPPLKSIESPLFVVPPWWFSSSRGTTWEGFAQITHGFINLARSDLFHLKTDENILKKRIKNTGIIVLEFQHLSVIEIGSKFILFVLWLTLRWAVICQFPEAMYPCN